MHKKIGAGRGEAAGETANGVEQGEDSNAEVEDEEKGGEG